MPIKKSMAAEEQAEVETAPVDSPEAAPAQTEIVELDVLNSPIAKKLDQKPNIKFVGRGQVAFESFSSGMTTIKLPPVDEQKAGFYHPQANLIIAEFPELFKPIVDKG